MSHYKIPKQLEMRPALNDTALPGISDFSSIISLTSRESKILAGAISCEYQEKQLVITKSKVITKQIREVKTALKRRQKWGKY